MFARLRGMRRSWSRTTSCPAVQRSSFRASLASPSAPRAHACSCCGPELTARTTPLSGPSRSRTRASRLPRSRSYSRRALAPATDSRSRAVPGAADALARSTGQAPCMLGVPSPRWRFRRPRGHARKRRTCQPGEASAGERLTTRRIKSACSVPNLTQCAPTSSGCRGATGRPSCRAVRRTWSRAPSGRSSRRPGAGAVRGPKGGSATQLRPRHP